MEGEDIQEPSPKRARVDAGEADGSRGQTRSHEEGAPAKSVSIKVNGLAGPRCTVETSVDWTMFQVQGAISEKLRIPVLWQLLLKDTQKLALEVTVAALLQQEEELQLTLVVEEPPLRWLLALLPWPSRRRAFTGAPVTAVNEAVAEALVWLIQRSSDPRSGEAAAKSLADLVFAERNSVIVARVPDTIPVMLELLQHGTARGKGTALRFFGNVLAVNETFPSLIAHHPNALSALVCVLQEGDPPSKMRMAGLLGGLATWSMENQAAIARIPHACSSLVTMLRHRNGLLQRAAARAVARLADGNAENQALIARTTDALPALVGLLRTGTFSSQAEAALALWSLADGNVENQVSIVQTPDAVTALLAMFQRGHDVSKGLACRILASLVVNAFGATLAATLARTEGALPSVVESLRKCGRAEKVDPIPVLVALLRDGDGMIQTAAAQAMWSLAHCHGDVKSRIAQIPEAVQSLLALLQNGDIRGKLAAAKLVGTLAHKNADNQASLAQLPGMSRALSLLLEHGDDAYKKHAAVAVEYLAWGRADGRLTLANCADTSDLVEHLACLLRSGSEKSKAAAAAALGNLAQAQDDKECIATMPEVLSSIVALLRGSCNSQRRAADAIRKLAHENSRNQAAFAGCEDCIAALVAVVCSASGETHAQKAAARALGSLAQDNAGNSVKIVQVAEAVPALRAMLEQGCDSSKDKAFRVLSCVVVNAAAELARTHGALPSLVECLQKCDRAGEVDLIPSLVALLLDGDGKSKTAAAQALWVLACHSHAGQKARIIRARGVVQMLMTLLQTGDSGGKRAAAGVVGTLAFRNADNQAMLAQLPGMVQALALLLEHGDEKCKTYAAVAVEHLAWGHADGRLALATCADAKSLLGLLARLLQSGSEKGKGAAAAALGNLAVTWDDQVLIAGLPEMLPSLGALLNGAGSSKRQAARVIVKLSHKNAQNQATLAGYEGVLPALAAMLRGGTGEGEIESQTVAANALGSLADGNKETAAAIGLIPEIIPLLLALSQNGGNRGAAKALTALAAQKDLKVRIEEAMGCSIQHNVAAALGA